MKLLHLFSNYKLTGAAEPAIRLGAHLGKRGHDVLFAHQPLPRAHPGLVDDAAHRYGLTTLTHFNLYKHFKPLAIWSDRSALAKLIDEHRFDVIHCNMINDHLTAALAVAKASHKPKIVRTNHDAVPMTRGMRERFLFPKRTDALIEVSEMSRSQDVAAFRMPPERVPLIDTAIELSRFDPGRELPEMRAVWGLGPDHFVVGIAARIQRHRRFDLLLDAAAIVREQVPNFRLVIIGRGTHKQSVAVDPAHQRGLDDIVVFPGYLRGDDYVAGLRALDAKVFLMPGTDGSCRAAREAMALGRPVIAARRGMLPELVTDGEDGLVFDDSPEDLAAAIARLAKGIEECRRMGDAARRTALERFDPERQAERVEQVYEELM
jgi:L-malate glycosyltransferase